MSGEQVNLENFSAGAFDAEIRQKTLRIREKAAEAAQRAGRDPKDVLLVGVSKYAAPDDGIVQGLVNAGVRDLGENRPQKLLEKTEYWSRSPFWHGVAPAFVPARDRDGSPAPLRWHFIGSLQRNKVRRILPWVSLIHSVDSIKLLEAIERILTEESESQHKQSASPAFPDRVSTLLEVHISNDETKQGFSPEEIPAALEYASGLKHVEIVGLMGMAGLTAPTDEIRRQFVSLRETLESAQKAFPEKSRLTQLSMGMSGDFEIAIEEGATIVRVGSALYPDSK